MTKDKPKMVLSVYRRNRRFYSYEKHRHTNAAEILPLLQQGVRLEVRDNGCDGKDVTRQALFAILVKSEHAGKKLITQAELEAILMRKPGDPHNA